MITSSKVWTGWCLVVILICGLESDETSEWMESTGVERWRLTFARTGLAIRSSIAL